MIKKNKNTKHYFYIMPRTRMTVKSDKSNCSFMYMSITLTAGKIDK